MLFPLFVFFTASLVVSAIVQNSFNDLSKRYDFQTLQDSPEDLLALNEMSDLTSSFANVDDDNLFADSNGAIDSFSSVGDSGADYFDLAEASPSCVFEDGGGQSLNKLRIRDGICTTNGQPSSDIDDFVNNALGIFRNPFDQKGEETQGVLFKAKEPDQFCQQRFPHRLCCEEEGELGTTSPVIYPAGISSPITYKTFDKCQTRT